MKHDLEKMRSEKKDIYFKQLEHTKIMEGLASEIPKLGGRLGSKLNFQPI